MLSISGQLELKPIMILPQAVLKMGTSQKLTEGYSDVMKFLTAMHIPRLLLLVTACFFSGCAAFRPINGVPARYLAPELRAQTRSNESTIDLSLLAQQPPRQHFVDAQDVLGIYIEGVLGNVGEAPPINVPTNPEIAPSIGYPVSVRDDGTISLPMIGTVNVRWMTIRQFEEHLRHIYTTEKKILKKDADTIIVSLQRPRQVRVLVLRQETGGPGGAQFAQGLAINLGQTKRGNGQVVHLPIYKNDVLHALAQTGGLPGLDAENTIYIIRRQHAGSAGQLPGYRYPNSPAPVLPQQPPIQQAPVTGNQISSSNNPSNPNIRFVSYHSEAVYNSTLEQMSAYHTSVSQPAAVPGTGGQNPFQHPLYRNEDYANVYNGASTNQFTIEPVTATNFGNPDPLAELRAGMSDETEQEYSEPVVLQREVTIEQTAAAGYNQAGYPQPVPQQSYPQSFSAQPGLQEPVLNAQPQYFEGNAPIDNFVAGPQPYGGTSCDSSAYHDQFWSQVDLDLAHFDNDPTMNNRKVIKIPIRLKPGQQPHIRPEDVILQDGDIVFIESRDTEIFYTGGLLGGGQYTLPRDYDLDVLGAISLAQGAGQQQVTGNQIGGTSALNGDVTISASSVIILRRMPNGAQVPIKVDLYRAMTDPSERILIQPGDIVMLRYKVHEAIGAFIERNILSSALLGIAATQFNNN